MKKIITLAVAAFSTAAMAQSTGNLYGEAAYAMVTTKDTSSVNLGSFDLTAARLTLGTVVTNNLAVEGFLSQGLSSDSKVISGVNVDIKAKTGYGFAVRPFVNLTNQIELFGRIGSIRNEVEATVSANGRSLSTSDKTTNTIYGAGVAYKFDKNMTAVVDYTKLSNKNDTKTSMVAIGVRFNF